MQGFQKKEQGASQEETAFLEEVEDYQLEEEGTEVSAGKEEKKFGYNHKQPDYETKLLNKKKHTFKKTNSLSTEVTGQTKSHF